MACPFLKDVTFRYSSSAVDSFRPGTSYFVFYLSGLSVQMCHFFRQMVLWESPCLCKNTILCIKKLLSIAIFTDLTKEMGTNHVYPRTEFHIGSLLNCSMHKHKTCSSHEQDASVTWINRKLKIQRKTFKGLWKI